MYIQLCSARPAQGDELFGDEGFFKVGDLVAELEKKLGVYDLSQYTPKSTAAPCHRLQEVVDPSFRERAWSIIRVSCCTFDTVRTARNRNRIHFAGNCREA